MKKNSKKVLTDLFRRCNIIGEQTNKYKSQGDRRYNMKFQHTINSEDVRNFCIHNNLYTRGDNEDYSRMLQSLDKLHNCTPQRVIVIAKDIAEHSDQQDAKIDLSLGNIAFYLCEDVMHTTLSID